MSKRLFAFFAASCFSFLCSELDAISQSVYNYNNAVIITARDSTRLLSVISADITLQCAHRAGMLKPEHAFDKSINARVANLTSMIFEWEDDTGLMTPEIVEKTRGRIYGPPQLVTYEEHFNEMLNKVGGCAGFLNRKYVGELLQAIKNEVGGYQAEAPLHEVMEGTPFSW